MATLRCPITQKRHSLIASEHPDWEVCPRCDQPLPITIGDSSPDSNKTLPPLTATISSSSSLIIPKATRLNLAQAHNIAKNARNTSISRDGEQSKPLSALIGMMLWGGRFQTTRIAGIPTRKWTLIARATTITAHRMLLDTSYNNHEELITAMFEATQVDKSFTPSSFRFVGTIIAGNGSNIYELHFNPDKPITLNQIRACVMSKEKANSNEAVYLNLLAEEEESQGYEPQTTIQNTTPQKSATKGGKLSLQKKKQPKKVKVEEEFGNSSSVVDILELPLRGNYNDLESSPPFLNTESPIKVKQESIQLNNEGSQGNKSKSIANATQPNKYNLPPPLVTRASARKRSHTEVTLTEDILTED